VVVVNEVLVVHSSSSPVLVLVGAGGSVREGELVAEVVKFQPLDGWKEKDEDEVDEGTADEPEVMVLLEEKVLLRDGLALELRLEALVMEAEALVREAEALVTEADELEAVELMVTLDEALELETVEELAEVMVTEADELVEETAEVTVEVTLALELELVGSSPHLCLTASRAC
jgi:hypothetical protein